MNALEKARMRRVPPYCADSSESLKPLRKTDPGKRRIPDKSHTIAYRFMGDMILSCNYKATSPDIEELKTNQI
jgi:hypothetical protein